jgi:hypothetical protein
MSKARRLPVAIGGLGAVVLLGIAASFAIGGEQSKTDKARAALHGGKGVTSSSSWATVWAPRRSPPRATTRWARPGG